MRKPHTKRPARKPADRGEALSKVLNEQLLNFLEHHPARRLSVNLRTMLMEFLMYEGATEAEYLQDLLYDLEGLFKLLEVAQGEVD